MLALHVTSEPISWPPKSLTSFEAQKASLSHSQLSTYLILTNLFTDTADKRIFAEQHFTSQISPKAYFPS